MQDTQNGLFFFDSFGTYDKNIAILSEYPVQIVKDVIFYIKDNQLNSYNYTNWTANTIAQLPTETKQALVFQNKLIISDGKTISINNLK